jgi:hypothetical protein
MGNLIEKQSPPLKRKRRNQSCTAKQEALARYFTAGPLAGNASRAYRKAYDKPADYCSQLASSAAYKLLKIPHVAARVQELRDQAAMLYLCDKTTIAAEFDENRKLAKREKQPQAMNSATMGKARVMGLIQDKQVVANVDLNKLYDQIQHGNRPLAEDVIEGSFTLRDD